MLDGILDFLVMVLVLGIVTGTSLNMTIPIVNETKQIRYDEIYDKTATSIGGEQANEYDGDGCMSYDEIILTVMSQSYFMPKPRLIDICGEVLAIKAEQPDEVDPGETPSFDISSTIEFTPDSADIGNWVRNKIDDWYKASELRGVVPVDDLRFCLQYDLGETEQKSDDMYALFILHQTGYENEPSLHRCLANGKLR